MRALVSGAILIVALWGAAAQAADLGAWRMAREARFAAFKASSTAGAIWDRPEAPELVVVPAGRFIMGPRLADGERRGNEGPRVEVAIPAPFALGKYPVTVGEFASFVAAAGHDTGNSCWTYEGIDGHIREGRGWRNPGFPQTDADPVLCVSWTDVQAYAAWLSRLTGHHYRLPTEAEYEYADRAGTETAFWWGEEAGSNHANCDGCGSAWDNRMTSPVGSFLPNPFGLYDTAGDTWVWMSDCYVRNPAAERPDAPTMANGVCAEHTLRGGAWHGGASGIRVFSRFGHTTETHSATLGFRLVREP